MSYIYIYIYIYDISSLRVNQLHYMQITNNMHFVHNDLYIINNEVNFVGVLSVIENCLFVQLLLTSV